MTDIELVVKKGEEDRLYQWDTDRQIKITTDLVVDEVQFDTILSKSLLVKPRVDVELGGVVADIPNILLQGNMELNVYVVMHTENGKHVTEHRKFEVIKRKKPSDYIYTEIEVLNYESLEKRVSELEQSGGGSGITKEPEWEKVAEIPMNTETVMYELASTNDYHEFLIFIKRVKATTGSGNVVFRLASDLNYYVMQNTNLLGSSFGYTNTIAHLSLNGDIVETMHKSSNNAYTGTPTYSIYENGERFKKDSKFVLTMTEEWAQATSEGDTITVYGKRRS